MKNINKVAIVGLGYVGIPLCKNFLEAGVSVIGIDVNKDRVKDLQDNKITLNHLSNINLDNFLKEKKVKFSSDFKDCSKCDAVIICVPTPLDKFQQPNLQPIENAVASILPNIVNGQIISLESTTYPGTCNDKIVKPLENNGFKVGEDIFVVYSPEREDPGNKSYDCRNTPKIVGGFSKDCLSKGVKLYSIVNDQPVSVSSCEVAEFAKLYENIYRAVNIGLANEMKVIADKFDIDIFEVIRAAATKPFGFSAFYPGPGVGGHCIPVDPAYLNWKARSKNVYSRLIDDAMEINRNISDFVVNKTIYELNRRSKSIKNSKILVLGVSYKSNIDDVRESPSRDIIEKLIKLNARVSFDDEFVTVHSLFKESSEVKQIKNATKSENIIKSFDAVLLLTSHDYYNYENIKTHSELVIDTRGIFSNKFNNIERG